MEMTPAKAFPRIARHDAPPRSAYIHVPFCRHRCGYCNFSVVAGRDELVSRFLQAIELELARLGEPREVETLYLGGGTPTHLRLPQLRALVASVLRWHPLARADAVGNAGSHSAGREFSRPEWTVEANPADLNPAMIETLSELGVTRLSIGAQSFRREKLRLLERDHESADIEQAVRWAHEAGLDVALDLIFAAPGETLAEWIADLEAAIALEPEHFSTYGLTFERGTSFWSRKERGDLKAVEEEVEREMYALTIDRLTAAGYEHYEISNFSRPGHRSRHNQVYWSGGGYYAAGPGAARYVAGTREINHRSTTTYLARVGAGQSPVAESETLSPEARARELLVFSLRKIEGVHRQTFTAQTSYDLDALAGDSLRRFVAQGLLEDTGDSIRLTREGLFVSDALWPNLV